MSDKQDFKTHIKEPRWQQVVSVVIVLGIVALWLLLFLNAHRS